MPRVYEVARELGLTSKELMARLDEIGKPVSSHSSSIDDATARELRVAGDGAPEPATLRTAAAPARAPQHAVLGASRSPTRTLLRHLAEIPMLVAFAFVIAVVIKTFLVQAFFIPSLSMLPTLHRGDRVLVEKISYLVGGPERGDVVVFGKDVFGAKPPDVPWYQDVRNFLRDLLGLPTGQEEDYIKRVVAVGGDTIRYTGDPRRLVVNNSEVEESYVFHEKDRASPTLSSVDCARLEMNKAQGGCRVPAGEVFVMGDNRSDSEDSRILGPIDEDKIVGKAFVLLWPPDHWGAL